MQALNLPTYLFNLKSKGKRKYILDTIRRKYVALTPEEWVRQNFIRYLNEEKKYPLSLLSVETSFALYNTNKRSDVLIHNRKGVPVAIVECKAPEVNITPEVFNQVIRYNLKYNLQIIMVTNGMNHYCCKLDAVNLTTEFLKEIPNFDTLVEISG